jgi:hypothetical protein
MSDIEADQPEPERRSAETIMQPETECLRKLLGAAGKCAEQHTADDHILKVGDQEQAIVQQEVGRWHSEQNASQAQMAHSLRLNWSIAAWISRYRLQTKHMHDSRRPRPRCQGH